jgi:hypothetical protein
MKKPRFTGGLFPDGGLSMKGGFIVFTPLAEAVDIIAPVNADEAE